jgi:ABC-type polysaccharide/polyol phosphate export permease
VTGNRGLYWLARREILRVSKLWTQTVLAPVISSMLFILVFGLALGGRFKQVEGFDYREFIVPGLITMAMVQAAYSNNSSSVFQARSDRYINDVLSAPMHPWQMSLGFNLGGVFYSVDRLGSPWQELSHVNPVFYLVNAVRYGFLGTSDANQWLCLGVTAALAIPVYLWSQYLFSSGRKLKA